MHIVSKAGLKATDTLRVTRLIISRHSLSCGTRRMLPYTTWLQLPTAAIRWSALIVSSTSDGHSRLLPRGWHRRFAGRTRSLGWLLLSSRWHWLGSSLGITGFRTLSRSRLLLSSRWHWLGTAGNRRGITGRTCGASGSLCFWLGKYGRRSSPTFTTRTPNARLRQTCRSSIGTDSARLCWPWWLWWLHWLWWRYWLWRLRWLWCRCWLRWFCW